MAGQGDTDNLAPWLARRQERGNKHLAKELPVPLAPALGWPQADVVRVLRFCKEGEETLPRRI